MLTYAPNCLGVVVDDGDGVRAVACFFCLLLVFFPALLVPEEGSFSTFAQFPLLEISHKFANLELLLSPAGYHFASFP